jgi:ankyrin repeat protein
MKISIYDKEFRQEELTAKMGMLSGGACFGWCVEVTRRWKNGNKDSIEKFIRKISDSDGSTNNQNFYRRIATYQQAQNSPAFGKLLQRNKVTGIEQYVDAIKKQKDGIIAVSFIFLDLSAHIFLITSEMVVENEVEVEKFRILDPTSSKVRLYSEREFKQAMAEKIEFYQQNVGSIKEHATIDLAELVQKNGLLKLGDNKVVDKKAKYIIPTVEALEEAVLYGNCNLVQNLIDAGADVNGSVAGVSMLRKAISRNYYAMIRLLVENNADIMNDLPYLLKEKMTSISEPGVELINYLLKENIIDIRNPKIGSVIVKEAINQDNLPVLAILLKNGVDLQVKNGNNQSLLYYILVDLMKQKKVDLFNCLFENRKNEILSFEDIYGNSLLHLAVRENRDGLVDFLLQVGFKVDKNNHYHQTALDIAREQNNPQIIKSLEEATQKVSSVVSRPDGKRFSPIDMAKL